MSRVFRFPKSRRLRAQRAFARVFEKPELVLNSRYFRLLAVAGEREARLGIAVPKKKIRKATRRNRLKRIIRESFRHRRDLPQVDVVLLVKAEAQGAPDRELWETLERLWQQLQTRWPSSSASLSADIDTS